MTGIPARNLELKVRCAPELLSVLHARLSSELGPAERLRQADTYFNVRNGRLKLRQIDGPRGSSAELVAYTRPNVDGARLSGYHLVPLPAASAEALGIAVAAAMGLRVVVAQTRDVWGRRRTRIHLDVVDDLGTFAELETVLSEGEAADDAAGELAATAAVLGLDRLPAVAGSYSDLMLRDRDGPS